MLCLVGATLCDLLNCSPPGSSVHGDSAGKNTGVVAKPSARGILPTQGWNPGLPHCRQILHHLSCQGSPLPGTLNQFTFIVFVAIPLGMLTTITKLEIFTFFVMLLERKH